MDSPFLVAHGGGRPVASDSTLVTFPEWGQYREWVRTRDWSYFLRILTQNWMLTGSF